MIIILIQNSMMIQYNDFLSNMAFNNVLFDEEFFTLLASTNKEATRE